MKQEDLEKIIESHGRWIAGKDGGECADLSGANLRDADLYDADLRWANLRGANLSDADLRWANLRGANLSAADLRGANLRSSNLSAADLRGANLRGANLSAADLRGANLRGANLSAADLRGANLSSANLRSANLSDANLCNAKLSGAKLPKTILQAGPIGSRKDYTAYNVTDDIVQCGCWNAHKGGTLEEFKERINEIYPEEKERTLKYRREYLAVIAYFETVRALEKEEQE